MGTMTTRAKNPSMPKNSWKNEHNSMGLLPSLRQKKRYVVFELLSDQKFSFPDIKQEVQNAILRFIGYEGMAKASVMILAERFNEEKQRFTVKINNVFVDTMKTALMLSTHIQQKPIIIKSLITSGTLKKAGLYLR